MKSRQPGRAGQRRPSSRHRPARPYALAGWLWLAPLAGLSLVLGPSQTPPATATAPLVIRAGGTYSGSYRSLDSRVPCISIETREPVTLRNCRLAGAGNLIQAMTGGARLTVINCRGYGLRQSRDQERHGHFLEVNSGQSVRVEHNYFEHTAGISIYQWGGDGSATQTLTVRYNQARNIDGRYRNGGGTLANFLGLNGVPSVGHMEVAWNQVINAPDSSLVEDNISFYNSGGTAASPARLHDNYIQGAYPYPATSPDYAGSGITLDGDARTPLLATAYVRAYANQLVSTCAAMNIAAGHDNAFYDNRIVTSGRLPDGSKLQANYAGIGLWNEYKRPAAVFHGNVFRANAIGFVHSAGGRLDLSPGACDSCTATTHLPNPITLQTEQREWQRWQRKLRQAGVQVGPVRAVAKPVAARPLRPR